VFQSHTPDGQPYNVVRCMQADVCYEAAYRFCQGPYQPLDKSFYPTEGFRFVCGAHGKHASQAADPASPQSQPPSREAPLCAPWLLHRSCCSSAAAP